MLADAQSRWAAYLLTGRAGDLGVTPATQPRLALYRANVLGGWTRTLALAHPATREAMGPAAFEAAARDFASAAPPPRPELNTYGDGFAAHLSEIGDAPPWLGDLAALEWLLHRAYFAEDEHPLDPARLARLDAAAMSRLTLKPQRALRLFQSTHPVVALHAHFVAGAPKVLAPGGEIALLWRQGPEVRFRAMGAGEAALVAALAAGHTLLGAAAAGAERDPDFNLQAALTRQLADGLYCDADLKEAHP